MNKKDFLHLPLNQLIRLVEQRGISSNLPINQLRFVLRGTMSNAEWDEKLGGNINRVADADLITKIKIKLKQLCFRPKELAELPQDYLPFQGNLSAAEGDPSSQYIITKWIEARAKIVPESPKKEPGNFGRDCVNDRDYSTQSHWDTEEPIKINFIDDGKTFTQCYEKSTLQASFVEEPNTLVARWLPNVKDGFIDENGKGGSASVKQWYYKLPPNKYIVWNTKLKSWINNYTHFTAYRVANSVRIGNLASLVGISLAHGGQEVPVYYIVPDDEYWEEKFRKYIADEIRARTAGDGETLADLLKANEAHPAFSDEYDSGGKLIGESAVREKKRLTDVEKLFLQLVHKVNKDYYEYYTGLMIEGIITQLDRLNISHEKIEKSTNEVENILRQINVVKTILTGKHLQEVDYRQNTVQKINTVEQLLTNYRNLFFALDGLALYVSPIEKAQIIGLNKFIDTLTLAHFVQFSLVKLNHLYKKVSFHDEKSLQKQLVETLDQLVNDSERLVNIYFEMGLDAKGENYLKIAEKHRVSYYKELVELEIEELPGEIEYYTDLGKTVARLDHNALVAKLLKEQSKLNFNKKLIDLPEAELRKSVKDLITKSATELFTQLVNNAETALFLYSREKRTEQGRKLVDETRKFITDFVESNELPGGVAEQVRPFINLPRPEFEAGSPETVRRPSPPPVPRPVSRQRQRTRRGSQE